MEKQKRQESIVDELKSDEDRIKEMLHIQRELANKKTKKASLTNRYKHSQTLVRNLKELYHYQCQLCDPLNPIPSIEAKDGNNYVEVHHLNGDDEVLNFKDDNQEKGDYVVENMNNLLICCIYHHKLFHTYKSPFEYNPQKKVFISKDKTMKIPLQKKHPSHKIDEDQN
jgi:predicted restriction endonuclease